VDGEASAPLDYESQPGSNEQQQQQQPSSPQFLTGGGADRDESMRLCADSAAANFDELPNNGAKPGIQASN